MKNLVATKKGYVRRLRMMLMQEKRCKCCHVQVGFNVNTGSSFQECWNGDDLRNWCRTFIGLDEDGGCPCLDYRAKSGKIDPIALAHKAIAQWDRGEHKWQKDD